MVGLFKVKQPITDIQQESPQNELKTEFISIIKNYLSEIKVEGSDQFRTLQKARTLLFGLKDDGDDFQNMRNIFEKEFNQIMLLRENSIYHVAKDKQRAFVNNIISENKLIQGVLISLLKLLENQDSQDVEILRIETSQEAKKA